jgi:hypothetical protein
VDKPKSQQIDQMSTRTQPNITIEYLDIQHNINNSFTASQVDPEAQWRDINHLAGSCQPQP